MIKPKHIRDAEKARINDIVLSNQMDMANIRLSTHAVHERTPEGKGFTTGYRASPSPKMSHRISLHPGKGAGRKAELLTAVSLYSETKALNDRYISAADRSLTDKQRQTKYRLQDQELYNANQKVKHTDNRCMVKVGMTKPHSLFITDKDTGEEVFVKIPAKPKYKEVGLP